MPPTSNLSACSLNVSDDATRAYLRLVEQQFNVTDEKLLNITHHFTHDFKRGLKGDHQALAMIPTFVTGVPDGSERGTFLALDLGGTNLRVCEVQLHGNKQFSLIQQKYKISDALKTGEATVLFDYLADSVDEFLTTKGHTISEDQALHLGLTFSFPVEQTALDKGVILRWTKGFSAKNAVGKDVVKLLQDAFDRKHIHVKCAALVNDTVGTLLSRSYSSGGCLLGAIFGTGTNGAYVEDVKNIKCLDSQPQLKNVEKMIVNTEWGGFDNARIILPTTPFDNKLDRESINPHAQAYEKFISGMYLGEIVRNVLLSLIDASPPVLFRGYSTTALDSHYGFDTAHLSSIEEARTPEDIREILVESIGISGDLVTDQDAEIVRWVCHIVVRRAARLSACSVAAVLAQTNYASLDGKSPESSERINIGVDGSLIQHYPNFELRLREALRALVGENVESRVGVGLAKDGSGVGAALCALQALMQEKKGSFVHSHAFLNHH